MQVLMDSRNETFEEGVGTIGFAQKFRVELAGDVEGMILQFDDFDQATVRGCSAEHKAGFLELVAIDVVEFVAVTVAFIDQERTVEMSGF